MTHLINTQRVLLWHIIFNSGTHAWIHTFMGSTCVQITIHATKTIKLNAAVVIILWLQIGGNI